MKQSKNFTTKNTFDPNRNKIVMIENFKVQEDYNNEFKKIIKEKLNEEVIQENILVKRNWEYLAEIDFITEQYIIEVKTITSKNRDKILIIEEEAKQQILKCVNYFKGKIPVIILKTRSDIIVKKAFNF